MKLLKSFNKSGRFIMSHIIVLGIDLAKDVFQLHGTDENGNVVLRKRLACSIYEHSFFQGPSESKALNKRPNICLHLNQFC